MDDYPKHLVEEMLCEEPVCVEYSLARFTAEQMREGVALLPSSQRVESTWMGDRTRSHQVWRGFQLAVHPYRRIRSLDHGTDNFHIRINDDLLLNETIYHSAIVTGRRDLPVPTLLYRGARLEIMVQDQEATEDTTVLLSILGWDLAENMLAGAAEVCPLKFGEGA